MGQYWLLVNFDQYRAESGGKLGEGLFNGEGKCLNVFLRKIKFHSLENTVREYTPGLPVHYRLRLAQTALASHSDLTDFPTELVDEVFRYLDDIEDVLVLSMTCQLLWSIGRRHIYAAMNQKAQNYTWADDRLMVVGDYLYNHDIPEGLLADEERSELLGRSPEYEGHEPTLYNYPYSDTYDPRSCGEDFFKYLGSRLEEFDPDKRVFRTLVTCKPSLVPSLQESLVLRNLTKSEYVVGRNLRPLRKLDEALAGVSLGDLVYSRICWSSDASVSMSYDGGIHQGVWAGDRFDLVSEEWLKELDTTSDSEEGKRWVDVSKDALDEMKTIWTMG
ncbi:hypothetical protein C8F01DRAFT_282863 [Mycena amicta]|nr:hypothetical protein C8F01DRAFT_282863 [Mycena amicta]